jgi:hypothetical protein
MFVWKISRSRCGECQAVTIVLMSIFDMFAVRLKYHEYVEYVKYIIRVGKLMRLV